MLAYLPDFRFFSKKCSIINEQIVQRNSINEQASEMGNSRFLNGGFKFYSTNEIILLLVLKLKHYHFYLKLYYTLKLVKLDSLVVVN